MDESAETLQLYVAEGFNIGGGLTFVVVLSDQANPNDSPGPYTGEKGLATSPVGRTGDLDTYTEVEWTYLTLLEMGLTEEEAMELLDGGDGENDPSPTEVKKPVFGPHFITFEK